MAVRARGGGTPLVRENGNPVTLLCFGYLALAIVVCTFTVRRYYRCPECEEVVTDSEGFRGATR